MDMDGYGIYFSASMILPIGSSERTKLQALLDRALGNEPVKRCSRRQSDSHCHYNKNKCSIPQKE